MENTAKEFYSNYEFTGEEPKNEKLVVVLPSEIIELMEEYHKSQLKNHGVIGDVSQQRELLIAFCDWYNKEIPDYLEKSDKTIDRYLDSNL